MQLYLRPNQALTGILNVWEDHLASKVWDNYFAIWRPDTLTLLSLNVKWYKCEKLTKGFRMQVSSQTAKQN